MQSGSRFQAFFLAVLYLSTAGCASLPTEIQAPSRTELDAVLAKPDIAVPDYALLTLSPQMKAFVKNVIPWRSGREHQVNELFRALNQPGVMRIEYDATANLTAKEVFAKQRANCLSFAALFVALAREAGFKANFQQVDTPPTWSRADNEIVVRYLHVNTHVDVNAQRYVVAEFQRERFDLDMPQKAITDRHASSLYYTNLGAEFLFEDNTDSARAYFVHALELHSTNAGAWVNLAVTHTRQGRRDLAEIAYRRTLMLDSRNTVALVNLAAIAEDRGESILAQRLRDRAKFERDKNPYYHYALAQRAFDQANYREAHSHLNAALRRDNDEHRFHYLMAQTMRALGKDRAARKSLQRAVRSAQRKKDKSQYQTALADWTAGSTQQ